MIFILLKLLPFFEGDNIFPAHIVLDVTDSSELCQETFATQRGASVTSISNGLVVFSTLEDIVEIHLVKLLVLLRVVFVEPE